MEYERNGNLIPWAIKPPLPDTIASDMFPAEEHYYYPVVPSEPLREDVPVHMQGYREPKIIRGQSVGRTTQLPPHMREYSYEPKK